jgi:hypothetical protein
MCSDKTPDSRLPGNTESQDAEPASAGALGVARCCRFSYVGGDEPPPCFEDTLIQVLREFALAVSLATQDHISRKTRQLSLVRAISQLELEAYERIMKAFLREQGEGR